MAKYQLSKAESMESCNLIGEYSSLQKAEQKAKEICPSVNFNIINDWTYRATGLKFLLSDSCHPLLKIEQVQR